MKNLKNLRQNRHLTQIQLANTLLVTQTSISDWERMRNLPHIDIIENIADYFNVTVDYLLGREDNSGITYPQRYIEVSDTERELITKFRKSRREAQKFILHLEDEEEQSKAKLPLDRA